MTRCESLPDRRCGYFDVRSYHPLTRLVTGNPSPDVLAYMWATYARYLGNSEPGRWDGVTIFGGCRIVVVTGYHGPKAPGVVTYFSSVELNRGGICTSVE